MWVDWARAYQTMEPWESTILSIEFRMENPDLDLPTRLVAGLSVACRESPDTFVCSCFIRRLVWC
jgi:hypothetical protein